MIHMNGIDEIHSRCDFDGRAIAKTLSGLSDITYTLRTGEYFHSAEEKVEMAEALLEKLDILEVDLIVAHSAGKYVTAATEWRIIALKVPEMISSSQLMKLSPGSYPALLMTVNQKKIRVRSIALICSSTSALLPYVKIFSIFQLLRLEFCFAN